MMNSVLNKVKKIQRSTENFAIYLCGLSLVLLMLMTSLEVALRQLVSYSIPGVFEMSTQLMVGASLLGISYVQRKKEHISIDVLTKQMPVLMNNIINLIVYVLGFFITLLFAWQGWHSLVDSFLIGEHTSGIVHVPIWPARLVVVLSMVLIATRFLLDIVMQSGNMRGSVDTSTEDKV